MEANFVRMKVPELKNNLQVVVGGGGGEGGWESVLRISVANNFWILISPGLSEEARELAIEMWDEQGDQISISAKLVTESETIPDPYSLKSYWTLHTGSSLTYCFFSGGKHLVLRRLCGVSLTSLRCFRTSFFRRFSLKILWECKYWGNRIQFSPSRISFEMNWTCSGVNQNI